LKRESRATCFASLFYDTYVFFEGSAVFTFREIRV
jgi:hypothetical protein